MKGSKRMAVWLRQAAKRGNCTWGNSWPVREVKVILKNRSKEGFKKKKRKWHLKCVVTPTSWVLNFVNIFLRKLMTLQFKNVPKALKRYSRWTQFPLTGLRKFGYRPWGFSILFRSFRIFITCGGTRDISYLCIHTSTPFTSRIYSPKALCREINPKAVRHS